MRFLATILVVLNCAFLSSQNFGPENYLSSTVNSSLSHADVNSDGFEDLLSIGKDGAIFWFENDGDGTFSNEHVIPTDLFCGSLFCFDIDNDGDQDIFTHGNDHTIYFFQNIGNGIFAEEMPVNQFIPQLQDLIAEDIDGDGDDDLISVTANFNSTFEETQIAWYSNLGSGEFSDENIIILNLDDPHTIDCSDIDGDGDIDILVGLWDDDNSLGWLENDGMGAFGPYIPISGLDMIETTRVWARDMDNDGDQDALLISNCDTQISWYPNDGNGQFGDQIEILGQEFTCGLTNLQNVIPFDFDEDGDMDIVFGMNTPRILGWIENDGSGTFGNYITLASGDHARTTFFDIADIDGDGLKDFVNVNSGTHEIFWHKNEGSQSLGPSKLVNSPTNDPSSVATGDIDGDGLVDALSASFRDNKIAWYKNLGNDEFEKQRLISDTSIWVQSIHTTDIDNDGDLDLVAAGGNNSQGHYVSWYKNDGNGEFSESFLLDTLDGSSPQWVLTGDLDGDLDEDIVSSYVGEAMFVWFQNDGLGNFSERQIIHDTTGFARGIILIDVDQDEDLDAITTSNSALSWHENDGIGNFINEHIILEGDFNAGIASVDLDNDQDNDLVVAMNSQNKIVWFENLDTAAFGFERILSLQVTWPYPIHSGDFDLDGDIDVLYGSSIGDHIGLIKNLGEGEFELPVLVHEEFEYTRALTSADFDNDGDIDIFTACAEEEKFVWLENLNGEGCMDPSACNYNPYATVENGSCCFSNCGCTDANAMNFDSLASCNDYSCQYSIAIQVFHDQDENGLFDNNDYGLANQNIEIFPDSLTLIADAEGMVSIDLTSELYEISLDSSLLFPFNTTLNPRSINLIDNPRDVELFFGISNEEELSGMDIHIQTLFDAYFCNNLQSQNVCIQNLGNVELDGNIQVILDPLIQGVLPIYPIDSIQQNTFWMSYSNLLPGELRCLEYELETPSEDFVGTMANSSAQVWGMNNADTLSFGNTDLELEILCAVDPNDKLATPIGYSEEHFILNDTIIEYKIRFQNVGNAPASTVEIIDTLDANLNFDSFELFSYSHSVQTILNSQSKEVRFLFENINLPDSASNENESQGFVTFKIRPKSDLPALIEINNRAFIYFDNNAPILTNTTWHNIFECGLMSLNPETGTSNVCDNIPFDISTSPQYVEDAFWTIGADTIGTTLDLNYLALDTGNLNITVIFGNPLCSSIQTLELEVLESLDPPIIIGESTSCEGDSLVLEANVPGNYYWYQDGNLVSDEFQITAFESSEIILESTDSLCPSAFDSLVVDFISLPEIPIIEFSDSQLSTPFNSDYTYQWFLEGDSIIGATSNILVPEMSGNYMVSVSNSFGCTSSSMLFILPSSVTENDDNIIAVFPNPMTQFTIIDLSQIQGKVVLELIDASGKIVRRESAQANANFELRREQLVSGIYILRIHNSEGSYELKLMVD